MDGNEFNCQSSRNGIAPGPEDLRRGRRGLKGDRISALSTRPQDREQHSLEQLALVRQLLAATGLSLRDSMFLAAQLVHHGFHEAEAVLGTLLREVPHASARNYFASLQARHAVIQSLPALKSVLRDQPRMLALYDPAMGSYFIPGSSRADTAVVVYTTANNNFGVSNAVFDDQLEDFGVARLYLKDPTRFLYFRGVVGLSDSLVSLPAAIARLLAAKGIRHTIVTGFSSGGLPALYTAAVLDASACLAFSAYTDFSRASALPQPRMFRNISREIDSSQRVNTADVIARSKALPGSIRLYYGLDHPIDRAHAQRLSELPQVRLFGIEDCGHYAATALLDDGALAPAFAEAVAAGFQNAGGAK